VFSSNKLFLNGKLEGKNLYAKKQFEEKGKNCAKNRQ
jgi:hypothetical protein